MRAFEARIEQAMPGGWLSYASRRALLADALALGIDRFEAHVLIALAQHRCAVRTAVPTGRSQGGRGWLGAALAVALVEGMLIAAVWRVLS